MLTPSSLGPQHNFRLSFGKVAHSGLLTKCPVTATPFEQLPHTGTNSCSGVPGGQPFRTNEASDFSSLSSFNGGRQAAGIILNRLGSRSNSTNRSEERRVGKECRSRW